MGHARSSSDGVLMSPTSPPYKSEEEHEHEEEDVGLLSATSNRLQHIASRGFHSNSARLTSSGWRKLILQILALTTAFLLGAFTTVGIIAYSRDSRDGGEKGKKVLNLAGEINGLVPQCEL